MVSARGLRSVTMSEIAAAAGIGRATLYKYFSDVDAILRTWHEREVRRHLEQVVNAADTSDEPGERLVAVLRAYARVTRERHGHDNSEVATVLHRGAHMVEAERKLRGVIELALAEAARSHLVREDVAVNELAAFSMHALAAARVLRSKDELDRLLELTLNGLRPR